jgi:PadR family transcriptional regulator, regulatory protein PadR
MEIKTSPATQTDKWEVQVRKGSLEMAILASLWPGRLYGLEILDLLERNAGLVLSAGTIYPLLARLKADGLVESEWVDQDVVHPRKYYSLTPEGQRRTVEMAQIWVRLSAGIGHLLSPVLKEDIA